MSAGTSSAEGELVGSTQGDADIALVVDVPVDPALIVGKAVSEHFGLAVFPQHEGDFVSTLGNVPYFVAVVVDAAVDLAPFGVTSSIAEFPAGAGFSRSNGTKEGTEGKSCAEGDSFDVHGFVV